MPIPRRDARAGEWVTGDASAEPDLATAARATGRERVIERHRYRKQRRAVRENGLRGAGECSRRRRGDDEAGGVGGYWMRKRPGTRCEQSGGGGAPDDQEERTEPERRKTLCAGITVA
ncbi:MAG: hypothetical protein PHG80_11195 [Methanoregulaceae archaeon]|nr:hypothetical protein [Methanoregulaceae archaeon]